MELITYQLEIAGGIGPGKTPEYNSMFCIYCARHLIFKAICSQKLTSNRMVLKIDLYNHYFPAILEFDQILTPPMDRHIDMDEDVAPGEDYTDSRFDLVYKF